MELPKTLLAAVVVGLTITATSCDKPEKYDLHECVGQDCTDDAHDEQGNCPACGMG